MIKMRRNIFCLVLTIFASAEAGAASAVAQTFSLDGRLYSDAAATNPLLDSGTLRIQILSNDQTCIIYEESQTFNTSDTDGYFHVSVGSMIGESKRNGTYGLDSNHTMAQVYANNADISGKTTGNFACTYHPTTGSARFVRVFVTTSDNTTRALSPNLALESVPTAVVAETLQGLDSSKFLQLTTTGHTDLTQSNVENVFDHIADLNALIAGTSAAYTKAGSAGSILPSPVAAPSGTTAIAAAEGQIWYDATSHEIKYSDGSVVQTVGASGAGITSIILGSGLKSTAGTTISAGGKTIDVDTGITAGKVVALNSNAELPAVSGKNLTNLSGAAIQSGAIGGTTSISTSGTILSTSSITAGTFNIYDHAGAGPGYVGITAPTTVTSYVLKMPAAQGGSNQVLKNDGLGQLSWVDLAVSNALALADGKIWIGDTNGKAQEKAITGDITLSNGGVARVVAIQSTGVSSTTPLAGQLYKYDSSTSKFIPAFIASSELKSSVTSTASFPSTMSCGEGKTMTYIVATDSFDCIAIKITASQIDDTTTAGAFVLNGGQAGAVALGSNDASAVQIETNNSPRLTVAASGNVGIGTTAPTSTFTLSDSTAITSGNYISFAPSLNINPASSSTGNYWGESLAVNYNSSQNITGGNGVRGLEFQVGNGGNATIPYMWGIYGGMTNWNGGTVSSGYGLDGNVTNAAAGTMTGATAVYGAVRNTGSGTISSAAGLITEINNSSTGTIATAFGVKAGAPSNSGGGSIGTYYGVYIENPTAAASNYALYSAGGTNYFGGNVGVGTTAPNYKLDVAGSLNANSLYINGTAFTPGSSSTSVATGGGAASTVTQTNSSSATGERSAIVLQNNGTGGANEYNLIAKDASGTNTAYIKQDGSAWFAGPLSTAGSLNGASLYTPYVYGGSGASQRLTIDSTTSGTKGVITIAPTGGNVGIGTTAPVALLEVAGTANVNGQLAIGSLTTASGGLTINNGLYTYASGATTTSIMNLTGNYLSSGKILNVNSTSNNLTGNLANFSYSGTGSGKNVVVSTTNAAATGDVLTVSNTGTGKTLAINSGSSSTVIDSNGFVGIGTTSPIAALNVVGSSAISAVFSGGGVGFGWGTPNYPVDVNAGTTANPEGIQIRNSGTSANGNSAGLIYSALDSAGTTRQTARVAGVMTDNTSTAYKGGLALYTSNNAYPAERMRIDGSGNVGIGTTAPSAALEVSNGTYSSQLDGNNLNFLRNGTNYIQANGAGADISFKVATNTLMRLDGSTGNVWFPLASGKVGIGTSAPASTLDVQSSTTEITSTTLSGTSFVQTIRPTAASAASFRSLNMSNTLNTTSAITGSLTAGWFENRSNKSGAVAEANGILSNGFWVGTGITTVGNVQTTTGALLKPVTSFGNTASFTVANAFGARIQNTTSDTANLVVTNQSGVFIEPITYGTNNTALSIGSSTIPTGNYGIYNASTNKNYFAGSVGIGTTAPGASYKLDVAGALNATTLYINGSLFTPGANSTSAPAAGGSAQTITQSSTDAASAERSALVVQNNGTGGANEYNLVSKNAAGTNTAYIKQDGSAWFAGALSTAGSSNGASLYTPYIYGGTAASQLLTIDSTTSGTKGIIAIAPLGGNVGIGTSNPTNLLQLATSGSNANKIYQSSTAGGTANTLESAGGQSWINLQTAATGFATSGASDTAGSINGNLFVSGTGFQTTSKIRFDADGAQTSTSAPGRLSFWTTPSGSTTVNEAMRITAAGKVGIGTTAPVGILDVQGGTAASTTNGSLISIVGQAAGSGANNSGGGISLTGGAGNGSGTAGAINLTGGASNYGGPINIAGGAGNNGPGTVTIAGGNGVAGNTNGAAATLKGGAGNGTANGGALSLTGGAAGLVGTGGSVTITSGAGGTTSGNSGNINLMPGSVTSGTSGSVGIGTTTPSTKTEILASDSTLYSTTGSGTTASPVVSTSAALQITNTNPTVGTGAYLQLDPVTTVNNYAYIGAISTATSYSPATVFGVRTGNGTYGERMRIDPAGNLGVGTNAPRALVDINGTLLMKASTPNGAAVFNIDFSAGNIQHSTNSCTTGTPFVLTNLKDGGSYTFIVKGTTAGTCSFTAYPGDTSTTALTVHMPPDHGPVTAGKHTLYSILVSGGDAYLSWIPGY